MSIYLPPSISHFEPKKIVFSTWIDHVPFGYDIVEAVKPKILVELGTYSGLSYFTFCQSMKDHDLDGLCYAVDTWEGDAHTKSYDESIFQEVSQYNREHYYGFSYLLKMRFDQALDHFNEESVDLLHIDGYHTYKAVSEDFTNWFPKVKPGGIILFHDTAARIEDFGVWKFWEEISVKYKSFSFNHGFGLGIILKPGGKQPLEPLTHLLFEGDNTQHKKLRQFYVHTCRFHDLKRMVGTGKFGKARKIVKNQEKTETG